MPEVTLLTTMPRAFPTAMTNSPTTGPFPAGCDGGMRRLVSSRATSFSASYARTAADADRFPAVMERTPELGSVQPSTTCSAVTNVVGDPDAWGRASANAVPLVVVVPETQLTRTTDGVTRAASSVKSGGS